MNVERNGDLGTLGSLPLLLDVDLDYAGVVSSSVVLACMQMWHSYTQVYLSLELSSNLEVKQVLLAFAWPRRTGINPGFVHRGSAEFRSGGCSFHYSHHR
jgi:hypothetical protein